jgi:hypothetical protein
VIGHFYSVVVSKAKKSKSIPDSDESDGDDKEDDESISATHSDEPKVPISNVSITSGKPPIESVDKTASSCTSDAANQDAPMGDSIGSKYSMSFYKFGLLNLSLCPS